MNLRLTKFVIRLLAFAICVMSGLTPAMAQRSAVPTLVAPTPKSGGTPFARPTKGGGQVSGPLVTKILVEGAQRIEAETVRSYMVQKQGETFDPLKINQSLKSLFATGLFSDVTIRRNGPALIVQVVENPIINRIAFEGNKEVEDENLSSEVQLRPRIVFTRKRVQSDVKRLLELYRRSGYFAARIEPKVIQLPQNRVDLVFEIREGDETEIESITFVGNRFFSDSSLRSVIQTKESRWYRFLSSSDSYDPDRLTFDRELLRRHYLENGFADFRVVSAIAELAPDQKSFFVTFTIEEGERYKFRKIDARSRIKEIDTKDLKELIKIESGDWYSATDVDDSVLALTNFAGEKGFAFVEPRPIVKRDRKTKSIDIVFELQEGPRVFVERIDVRGNVRTLDKVIRREFRIVEGDAFNAAKLRRSRQRVQNLGYFSKVVVNSAPGSAPDKSVVEVELEEQSTGEISLGVGFSSSNGGLVEAGLSERNFLGRGQTIKVKFSLSQRTQNYDLGFTEPYFLDKNVSAGVDLFRTQTDNTDESSFTSERFGGGLRFGYEINEDWRQRVRYLARREKITDVDTDASRFIQDQEGTAITSLVGQDLTLDTRNSRRAPTEGYVVKLTTDFAGLAGDVRFFRVEGFGVAYLTVFPEWIFSVSGNLGHITGLSDEIRINDRFFLGGDNLRGFEISGVGPRDPATSDSLGGRTIANGSVELQFPLFLPDELGFNGAVFADIGTLINPEEDGGSVQDVTTPRMSVGVGLSWRSPFGPVRLDLAIPIRKEDFDKEEFLRFNFGTRF